MKKIFILIAATGLLCSCGSNSSNSKTDDKDSVSTEVKELQKSSDEINAKSNDLNKKADSLLNNI